MAESGSEWQEVARSGKRWRGVARNGTEWQEVARSGKKWHGVERNGTEWKEMARSGKRWRKAAKGWRIRHRRENGGAGGSVQTQKESNATKSARFPALSHMLLSEGFGAAENSFEK